MTKQFLDSAASRILGVLVSRPDASDAFLAEEFAGDTDAAETIARARTRFAVGAAHWYQCGGESCARFSPPLGIGAGSPCAMTTTGCQGPCDRGPIGSMRCGDRIEAFAGFDGAQNTLGRYLRNVAAAGHFWVDANAIEPLRFDAVHAHQAQNTPNGKARPDAAVDFLAGHFRGVGRYADSGARFFKELLGTWDAKSKVLSLRMAVGFPLRDGHRDNHEALVLIRQVRGDWVGHAFADGGGERAYRYEVEADGTLCFSDHPPGHGDSAQRARKRLVPNERGYDERLEVERGGAFELYSEVAMMRVTG